MDIAAFASFLALIIAWLVLPLRVPVGPTADRELSSSVEVSAAAAA